MHITYIPNLIQGGIHPISATMRCTQARAARLCQHHDRNELPIYGAGACNRGDREANQKGGGAKPIDIRPVCFRSGFLDGVVYARQVHLLNRVDHLNNLLVLAFELKSKARIFFTQRFYLGRRRFHSLQRCACQSALRAVALHVHTQRRYLPSRTLLDIERSE